MYMRRKKKSFFFFSRKIKNRLRKLDRLFRLKLDTRINAIYPKAVHFYLRFRSTHIRKHSHFSQS